MKKLRGSYTRTALSAVAILVVVGIVAIAASAQAQTAPQLLPYTTSTVAGQINIKTSLPLITPGNGGPATAATLNGPRGVAVDAFGNIYIADTANSPATIRKVDARTGVISIFAGGGAGSPTDGAQATAISLSGPRGVYVDAFGNVWIDESSGNRIDKVTPDGKIYVIAKSSKGGYGADGNLPSLSSTVVFYNPETVVTDLNGDAYIADVGNCIVRKVTNPGTGSAVINTVMGHTPNPGSGTKCTAFADWSIDGADGMDCVGANAPFLGQIYDVAVDGDGNIYVADNTSYRVRECFAKTVTRGGVTYQAGKIYTIAGTGNGCTPTAPSGGPFCPKNTAGTGSSWSGFGPSAATQTDIGHPVGLKLDSLGNLYISDSSNGVIWYLDFATQQLRVVAGYGPQQTPPTAPIAGTNRPTCNNTDLHLSGTDFPLDYGDGCPGPWSRLTSPQRLALDPAGNLYVAEQGSTSSAGGHVIRKISVGNQFTIPPAAAITANNPAATTGPVNNILVRYGVGDTPSADKPFASNGDFSVADDVCAKNPDGTAMDADVCVIKVAFNPARAGVVKNFVQATSANNATARFNFTGAAQAPVAAIDPGTVSVPAVTWHAPQGVAVDQLGNVYVADTGANVITKNTAPILATGLNGPKALATDGAGNVFIADSGNGKLLRLDAVTGNVTTLASKLGNPSGVAVDQWGNVFVSDTANNKVLRVDALTKQVVVAAGGATAVCTGASNAAGDGCRPTEAMLSAPAGLAVDAAGNLYVADQGNSSIRKIDFLSNIITKASGTVTTTNPAGVALDAAGNIYYSSSTNHVVRMISATTGEALVVIGVTGNVGSAGADTDSAQAFKLNTPVGIAVDSFGGVAVADSGNNRILAINRGIGTLNFGALNLNTTSSPLSAAFTSIGNLTLTLQSPCYTESGNNAPFQLTVNCADSLNPGQTLSASAKFAPTDYGFYDDQVDLKGNSLNGAQLRLSAQGGDLIPTRMTATPSTTAAEYSQKVTIDIAVTAVLPEGSDPIVPEGTVSCTVGGKTTDAPDLVNGSALIDVTSQLVFGNNSVECFYTPAKNTQFAPTNTQDNPIPTITVSKADIAISLSSSPAGTAEQYRSVCFTATVSAAVGSGYPKDGRVDFYSGGKLLNVDPDTGTLLDKNGSPSIAVIKTLDGGIATFCTGTTPENYTTLAPGTYGVTARYLDGTDTNFNAPASDSAPLPLTITMAKKDFTMSFKNPALSIAGGQAGTTITVTPVNFPLATITFSCSDLPAYAWCSFVPNSMQFTNHVLDATKQTLYSPDSPLLVNFTITTDTATVARVTQPRGFGQMFVAFALLCPGLVFGGFALMGGTRRRKSLRSKLVFLMSFVLLGAMIAGGLIGCGGGRTTMKQNALTPRGPVTIKVNAVMSDGAEASHTLSYPITIQ